MGSFADFGICELFGVFFIFEADLVIISIMVDGVLIVFGYGDLPCV